MTTPFTLKLIDITNLAISKGSNFILVSVIFWLSSKNMNTKEYAAFGYWWSVAIMIGGILFGGLSSSLIRVLSIRNSLAHLIDFYMAKKILLLAFSIIITIDLFYHYFFNENRNIFLLTIVLILFGISIQLQTLVLALFRAIIATRANTVSSIISIIFIPLTLWLMVSSENQDLQWLFLTLATAFFLNTVLICMIYKQTLLTMFTEQLSTPRQDQIFSSSILSFTAINTYTYLMLNIDFTLFKYLQPEKSFTTMATGKIFFERFILPFLLVIAGAASLSILRHRDSDSLADNMRKLKITPYYMLILITVWVGSIFGYLWFETVIRAESTLIPIFELSVLTLGYLIYSINAILFDILVIRCGFRVTIIYVAIFLIAHTCMQAIFIQFFSLTGWVLSWLLLNVTVLITLTKSIVSYTSTFAPPNSL